MLLSDHTDSICALIVLNIFLGCDLHSLDRSRLTKSSSWTVHTDWHVIPLWSVASIGYNIRIENELALVILHLAHLH